MATPARMVLASRATAMQRPACRALSTTRHHLAKKNPPAPKPLILEKPAKFNPPSHGARLGKKRAPQHHPQHYGGQLSAEELRAQETRDYPTLMAPAGTWAHWFWTSRLIHVFITTGTLLALGIATFFMNFNHTSPVKHLIPPIEALSTQPGTFLRQWMHALSVHYEDSSRRAFESRARNMDDVLKRQAFQIAHGTEKGPMEKYFGFGRQQPEEDEEGEGKAEKA